MTLMNQITGADGHSARCALDRGIVTSPHPLATKAGLAVLQRGGTAAEAIVAAGAVLTVVCPHFCGLGGDGVWMLADDSGNRQVILGFGQSARHATSPQGAPLPERGARSTITSAGLVASWDSLIDWSAQKWSGHAELGDLLSDAIRLAEDGFGVTASQHFWTEFRREEFRDWPGFSRIFAPNGQIPAPRDLFRQPDLARTLRDLKHQGSEGFYRGALAAELADALAKAGSPLDTADLAATRAQICAPLSTDYRGWTLMAPPPPSQGLATLNIMAVLNLLWSDAPPQSEAERLHHLVEAVKAAFIKRPEIADPAFADHVPAHVDTDWAARSATGLSRFHATPWPHDYQSADTVFLAASDRYGNHVSGLQSTYYDWGSGVVLGDTGVIWHNRGAAFSTDPKSANVLAPGKRPFHTLNPGMAFGPDGAVLLYGTQGADGQPQTLTRLLTGLLDFGLSPEDALRAPRFLLGKTFSDKNDSLKIEADIGDTVLDNLTERGHDIAPIAALSPLAGLAGVISIDKTGKSASHDPRGEGVSLAE